MSVLVTSWVWSQSPVEHRGDLLVLLALADHAHDDGGSAYPSVDRLARKARLTRRGTQLALRRLEATGAIEGVRGGGPRGTTAYRIVMEGANSLRSEVSSHGGELDNGNGRTRRAQGAKPSSPKPSIKSSENRQQQLRAIPPKIVGEVAGILDGLSARPVDRQALAAIIEESPGKPHLDAASEVADWSKRERLCSVLAAFQKCVTDLAEAPPPPPEVEPATAEQLAVWSKARAKLRAMVDDTTFDIWLDPLQMLGADGDEFVLGAPDAIRGWVADRLPRPISDALGVPWRLECICAEGARLQEAA